MPLTESSPYEALGVPPTADVREIRHAARTTARTGRVTRRQIEEASALLQDPDRRLAFDLEQPLPPAPARHALDLLAPVLTEPLVSLPDHPPWPQVASLVTLRRADTEADFAEPPLLGIGEEPEIPGRFTAGLSVLPHVEFPV